MCHLAYPGSEYTAVYSGPGYTAGRAGGANPAAGHGTTPGPGRGAGPGCGTGGASPRPGPGTSDLNNR